MAVLALLVVPVTILVLTSVAAVLPEGLAGLSNAGPHGFSELLYAYSSAAATNGSAFAGLNANTIFFNLTLALAMLCGKIPRHRSGSRHRWVARGESEGPCLGRHPADRRDAICLSDRRHCFDSWGSHLLPGARARSSCRALFRVPAALILVAWPECSSRRFNRVSNWPFISRLFRGALSHLDFICRNGHIIGTVPGPSNGFEASIAIDNRLLKGRPTWHRSNLRVLGFSRASLATSIEIIISPLHRDG